MTRFATPEDRAFCRDIHRKHGTTYYFATSRFPKPMRERVHALYAFVRVPDEWVDNPQGLSLEERRRLLDDWGAQLERGVAGHRPDHPGMRAFVDLVNEVGMPLDEPRCFLEAMATDLWKERYADYSELEAYMRGSAAAVGLMMLHAMEIPVDDARREAAMSLGNAMQMTNFLRDVGEDLKRGRIYLPLADMVEFGVSVASVEAGQLTPEFAALMQFEIERTRRLYAASDAEIERLPDVMRRPVKLARILYSRILDRIEQRGYDVFSGRARTSKSEKLAVAARLLLTG